MLAEKSYNAFKTKKKMGRGKQKEEEEKKKKGRRRKEKKEPYAGLEPATLRLRVSCSTD